MKLELRDSLDVYQTHTIVKCLTVRKNPGPLWSPHSISRGRNMTPAAILEGEDTAPAGVSTGKNVPCGMETMCLLWHYILLHP
jgi:hypothetical protein